MTKLEARRAARARWGPRGFAWEDSTWVPDRGRFRVGIWSDRGGPVAYGYGNSYEAALADADMRRDRSTAAREVDP